MIDPPNNVVSPVESSSETNRGENRTVSLNKDTVELLKRLAQHYDAAQVEVVEAALVLLQDRVDGIDVLHIPELIAGIADLEETVGRLVVQAEQMERLAFELAALEVARGIDA